MLAASASAGESRVGPRCAALASAGASANFHGLCLAQTRARLLRRPRTAPAEATAKNTSAPRDTGPPSIVRPMWPVMRPRPRSPAATTPPARAAPLQGAPDSAAPETAISSRRDSVDILTPASDRARSAAFSGGPAYASYLDLPSMAQSYQVHKICRVLQSCSRTAAR